MPACNSLIQSCTGGESQPSKRSSLFWICAWQGCEHMCWWGLWGVIAKLKPCLGLWAESSWKNFSLTASVNLRLWHVSFATLRRLIASLSGRFWPAFAGFILSGRREGHCTFVRRHQSLCLKPGLTTELTGHFPLITPPLCHCFPARQPVN